MDIQGPPVHYPNSHESTDTIFRTRESTPRESVSAGRPSQQLPPYGEEGAPPRYASDDLGDEGKDGVSNERKTLLIRLMTSILIVTIVALVIAAVFGRIDEVRAEEAEDELQSQNDDAGGMPSLPGEGMATSWTGTTEAEAPKTTMMTATRTTMAGLRMTTLATQCPSINTVGHAAQPTGQLGDDTEIDGDEILMRRSANNGGVARGIDVGSLPQLPPANLGVSTYASGDCTLERASYRVAGEDLRYVCTISCPTALLKLDDVAAVMLDEWEWDSG